MSYSPIIGQQYLTELSRSNRKAFTKQPMDNSLNFFYENWKNYCKESTLNERIAFFKANYQPKCALDYLVDFALTKPSNKTIVEVKNLIEIALGHETVAAKDIGHFQVVNPFFAYRGTTPSPTPSSVSASPSPASPPTIPPPAAPRLPPPPPEPSF